MYLILLYMNKIIIEKLSNLGCFKFGEFKLKTGQISPFYINLRDIISDPDILKTLSRIIYKKFIEIEHLKCIEKGTVLSICGLPYAGIPIASYISCMYNIPLLILRKERKDYGTKKLIEGVNNNTSKIILIDDIITSGSSINESLIYFKDFEIVDILVIIDREQKKQCNFEYNSLYKITEIFQFLKTQELVSKEDYEQSILFLKGK